MPQNTKALTHQLIAVKADLDQALQYMGNAGNRDDSAAGLLLRSNGQRAAKTLIDSIITRLTAIQTACAVTQASLTTAMAGTQNDLVLTAVPLGENGNGISITLVDPGGTTATLGCVVTGTDIVVNLGRAASAINTTGTLLKGILDGTPAALALVTSANAGGNDGTGLVTALSKSTLTGGVN